MALLGHLPRLVQRARSRTLRQQSYRGRFEEMQVGAAQAEDECEGHRWLRKAAPPQCPVRVRAGSCGAIDESGGSDHAGTAVRVRERR